LPIESPSASAETHGKKPLEEQPVVARILALALMAASAAAYAVPAAQAPRAVVEAAPLKGALGQLSLRGELGIARMLALGVVVDQTAATSERHGYVDTARSLGGELLWYPLDAASPLFLGAGLGLEWVDVGREEVRDAQTWMRTQGDQLHDRWANEDIYLSSTQTVGYRIFGGRWLTGSLRFVRDELLTASSHVRKDDVFSQEVDLSTRGREPVRHRLGLHCGIVIP
jgi:hypothetical protein